MAVRSLLLRRPLVGVNPTSLDEYSMFGIVASAPLSIKYSAVPVPVNTPTISHALAFRPIPISAHAVHVQMLAILFKTFFTMIHIKIAS